MQVRHDCSICAVRFPMGMRLSILRVAVLFFSLPVCAFSARNVVNLSHYDMMRPDFATMKREGIMGVIHEATYPPFVRDAKYLDRQMGALQAGLLWGAYHYANGSDPIRQADHFLSVVSSAWAQADSAVRPAQVFCSCSISKRMVIIPVARCALTKPSRLSNEFVHAPVYIRAFIRANTIWRRF